jgi:nucleoside-diphosphate-sugar epimerase
MVTGAGGSIGSELCTQIFEFKPENLILYDKNENNLFYLEHKLKEINPTANYISVVGDINDTHKLESTLSNYCPDIIFHAAAHKHVPLMELNPEEAIKNNIMGTMNVAESSGKYGVEKFILISTDKAVNPVSVMGVSKRIAELFIQGISRYSRTRFMIVRFGNVLASVGSVVPTFQEQIKKGGPVTVTDQDIARFFMTIPEAVQLILQASSIGKGGEIFILDMGEPIKIVDIAKHLITLSGFEIGKDIEIAFTGLRPGDKLLEELWNKGEDPIPTIHKKILVARPPILYDWNKLLSDIEELHKMAIKLDRKNIISKFKQIVPEYVPSFLWTSEDIKVNEKDSATFSSGPKIPGIKEKILAIDREEDELDLIIDCLYPEYSVITARSGNEAIEKIALEKPNLIIIDSNLEKNGNIKTLEKFKSNPLSKDIPIIMLMKKGDMINEKRSLSNEADDYVAKPFNTFELKSRVKILINKQG